MINVKSGRPGKNPRAAMARGFTLIELMIALTILGILIGLVAPSFNNAALGGKLSSFASSLVASTQIARSEAIKRNAVVTVCASEDGTTCGSSGGWEKGWIVVLADGTVLQRQQELPSEFRIDEASDIDTLDFPPSVIGATTAAFTVCRATPVGKQNRVVTVTASGSTRVTQNTATSCP